MWLLSDYPKAKGIHDCMIPKMITFISQVEERVCMPIKYGILQKIRVYIFGSYKEPSIDEEQFPEASRNCSNCEIRSLFLSELKKFYKHTPKEPIQDTNTLYDPMQEYNRLIHGKV